MAARKTAHVTEVPVPRSTRIITCANHKGGTGKTTTAVNVSAGLAMLTQQRVLLIDFDPRGHASLALGIDRQHVRYSVTDLLTGARPEVQALCWHPGAHLHILPAHATLTDVERDFGRRGDSRLQLQQALQPLLDAFDVMVIDTPPTLGFWTQAPLVASTDLLIPVDMGYFALAGMRQLLDAVARLRQEVPLTLTPPHILLTKCDARTTLSAHVRAHLRERDDAAALHTVIRVNVALARAQMARQSIFAYDRTSRGAQDYQHVVEELLGTRRVVVSRGTVIPFRHPRRGPGSRTAPKSGRAAHADSLEPEGFHNG
jgi:chromosome partitioning protein